MSSAATPQKPTRKKTAPRKQAAKKQPPFKRKPHESFDDFHARAWLIYYDAHHKNDNK